MKAIRLIIFMSSVLFFTSCKDDTAEPVEVIGDWQSRNVYVKGKLQEDVSYLIRLLLRNDNVYQRGSVTGKWSLNGKDLELSPTTGSSKQPINYKVVNLTGTSMTLQITLTEKEYGWDFKDAEPDELITVTEMYRKSE